MTEEPEASVTKLLNASRDDLSDLQLPLSDRGFGFHAQQAIEKLFKALIAARGSSFEYTHDLDRLIKQLRDVDEAVSFPIRLLDEVSSYAVEFRYDEPDPLDEEARRELLTGISLLRKDVLARLAVLHPGIAWPPD